MGVFKRLWVRVCAYSLVLVVFSGAMGFYLVHQNLTDEAAGVVLTFSSELRKALQGLDSRGTEAFLRRFNNQEARFWLEDDQGALLAGERFAGKSAAHWGPHLKKARHAGDVTLWQTDLEQPLFLAVIPCPLSDGPATLYAAYMAFPVPPISTLLSPGIITLALITGISALWMAAKVCRPLRRLQKELHQSSKRPQLEHVTVSGTDEIADVARAVNRLVDGLKSHMDAMNQLVLNISHELRSPITRMALSAEMIGNALEPGEHSQGTLESARANCAALRQELEYMDKLIGDTLDAGKLDVVEAGEIALPVSLSALCARAAESYDPLFRNRGLRFFRRLDEDAAVIGDERLLTRLLANLLDNAVKYADGDEPFVRLRLEADKTRVELCVENSLERPLPPEILERLFDPYYRYRQQIGTGVGLGLALVKKIATLHKGDLTVRNTQGGIVFCLALPPAPPFS